MQCTDFETQPAKLETGALPLLMTIEAVAEFMNVSASTIRRLVENGTFPAGTKISAGCLRWHRDAVLEHRLLKATDVARQLSVSSGHFYRLVKHQIFPRPDVESNGNGEKADKRWFVRTVEIWASEKCPP